MLGLSSVFAEMDILCERVFGNIKIDSLEMEYIDNRYMYTIVRVQIRNP